MESVHRGQTLNMAYESRRQAGDGVEGLFTQNGQAQLLQREGEGGTNTHISLDGPGGATRGISNAEPQIPTRKDMLADKT